MWIHAFRCATRARLKAWRSKSGTEKSLSVMGLSITGMQLLEITHTILIKSRFSNARTAGYASSLASKTMFWGCSSDMPANERILIC